MMTTRARRYPWFGLAIFGAIFVVQLCLLGKLLLPWVAALLWLVTA